MPRTSNSQPGLIGRARRAGRRWGFEIRVALAFTAAQMLLDVLLGVDRAAVIAFGAALSIWASPLRVELNKRLVSARRRRRWDGALSASLRFGVPRVIDLTPRWHGEAAVVRVAAGATVTQLERSAEAVAAHLGVAKVSVRRDPAHAGRAELYAMSSDPLADPAPPWPWLAKSETTLWAPVPFGVDEDGGEVRLLLPNNNLLLGGEPGAGKSVALAMLVAAAALDPTVSVWLLDGKRVELGRWKPVAAGFAGPNVGEAIDLLENLRQVIDARLEEMEADNYRRGLSPGVALHVVACDELAYYLTGSDRKARDALSDALRDIVARGRAAGVILVAATQKPGSDVVPTSIRDLIGYRFALRCTTGEASDTILGSGWATKGVSAADIAPATRGVGYLRHESGLPQRIRTHCLSDADLDALVTAALRARSQGDPRLRP